MTAQAILNALDGVKSTGRDKWVALCPVHGDRSASMGVKECSDGTVLVNCFSCGASGMDVVLELGLHPSELFPPDSSKPRGPSRQQQALAEQDKLVQLLYKADRKAGKEPSLADYRRYKLAIHRTPPPEENIY